MSDLNHWYQLSGTIRCGQLPYLHSSYSIRRRQSLEMDCLSKQGNVSLVDSHWEVTTEDHESKSRWKITMDRGHDELIELRRRLKENEGIEDASDRYPCWKTSRRFLSSSYLCCSGSRGSGVFRWLLSPFANGDRFPSPSACRGVRFELVEGISCMWPCLSFRLCLLMIWRLVYDTYHSSCSSSST
jgi:hypothetical protein